MSGPNVVEPNQPGALLPPSFRIGTAAPVARRLAVPLALVATALAAPCAGDEPGPCLVAAARRQVGVTVLYDPAYRRLAYPGGDLPADRGVCTDVLVRAYRAFGVDLQALVHEDMSRAWDAYPKLWGLSRPDANIDHRRVPNLATFLARHGQVLEADRRPASYSAGDVVTWRLPSGVPHIGLVSDRRTAAGGPLVIHNIGRGTLEEDVLLAFEITGHYRWLPAAMATACREAGGGAR